MPGRSGAVSGARGCARGAFGRSGGVCGADRGARRALPARARRSALAAPRLLRLRPPPVSHHLAVTPSQTPPLLCGSRRHVTARGGRAAPLAGGGLRATPARHPRVTPRAGSAARAPSALTGPSGPSARSPSAAPRPPRRLPPSFHTPPVPLPPPLSSSVGKSCEFFQWWRGWRWGGLRVAHPWCWGLQGLGSPRPRRQVKPSVCGLAKAGSSGRRGHACLKRLERGQPPAALGTWSSGPGGCESGKHKAAVDNCSSAFKYCDSELLSKREHFDASDIEENLCNYPAALTLLREVVLDHRNGLPSNKIPCYHCPKAEWRYKAAVSVSNFRAKKRGGVALRPQHRYASSSDFHVGGGWTNTLSSLLNC
ncbi:uncharacterized protein LOC114057102 [Empidonax traillii]|uniref:uncharacterized protein LOC114057102 n=1 Tax=Empidonax traillii TaxID=164674 RepID=UPI000FFD0CFF|nr:uncharacterized protein LOC114057102 [Empidonax traillii]